MKEPFLNILGERHHYAYTVEKLYNPSKVIFFLNIASPKLFNCPQRDDPSLAMETSNAETMTRRPGNGWLAARAQKLHVLLRSTLELGKSWMFSFWKTVFASSRKKINLSGRTQHIQLPIKSGKEAKAWGYPHTPTRMSFSCPGQWAVGQGAGQQADQLPQKTFCSTTVLTTVLASQTIGTNSRTRRLFKSSPGDSYSEVPSSY